MVMRVLWTTNRPHDVRVSTENITLKFWKECSSKKIAPFWSSGDSFMPHDNAPAHSSNQFSTKHNVAQLRLPPYSPDITPCEFWLFTRLKIPLKVHRSEDKDRVDTNTTSIIEVIPKTEFQDYFASEKADWRSLFNQLGKDVTSRITKNKTKAEKWRHVGYFWNKPRKCYYLLPLLSPSVVLSWNLVHGCFHPIETHTSIDQEVFNHQFKKIVEGLQIDIASLA